MLEESNPIPPHDKKVTLCALVSLTKSNYDTLISDDCSNIRSPQLPELSDWRGNESVSEEAADRERRRPDRRFSRLATCSGAVHILLNTALTLRSLRPRRATRQDQGGAGNLTNGEYSPMSWVPSTAAWNTPEKRDDSTNHKVILDLRAEVDFSSFTIWDSRKMNRKYDPNFSENQGKKKRTLVCMSIHGCCANIWSWLFQISSKWCYLFLFVLS